MIVDVTLRDGLMARGLVSVARKAAYLTAMAGAGIREFELVRFPLSPDYPQFDQADELLQTVAPFRDACRFSVFAFGPDGVSAALRREALFDEIHVPCFLSRAYEIYAFGEAVFERDLSLWRASRDAAARAGEVLTVGLGTAFVCPLAGRQPLSRLVERCRQIADAGIGTIMLGDTAGQAVPEQVEDSFAAVRAALPGVRLRAHMHETFGRALANSLAAVKGGADAIDCSALGLGGEPHPYFRVPEQACNGNLALEVLAALEADRDPSMALDLPAVLREVRALADDLRDGEWTGRTAFSEIVPLGPEPRCAAGH